MKDDNFKVIRDFKKTTILIDNIVINFPRTDMVLRDNIMSSMYDALKCMYIANEIDDTDRIKYIKQIIADIKMVDFYLKRAKEKKYISIKQYYKVSGYLFLNLKLIYGWAKSAKEK